MLTVEDRKNHNFMHVNGELSGIESANNVHHIDIYLDNKNWDVCFVTVFVGR